MVDRISISTSRIITRDSSGTTTFDTNKKYFKTVQNGDFEVGGIQRGPCLVGYAEPNNDQFYDFHQNKGFTTMISRSSVQLVPGVAFTINLFVPSHAYASKSYSASHSTYYIGRINGGGAQFPHGVTPTITTLGSTSSSVATLHRRASTSASWSSIDTGQVYYYSASFTASGTTWTLLYYEIGIDLLQAAVNGRGTSYYYRLSLPSTWNSTMQNASGQSTNYGSAGHRTLIPSVGREPTQLDLTVTP